MKISNPVAVIMIGLFIAVQALAGGTSVKTTTDKDGRKITTKVSTDNQGTTTTIVTVQGADGAVSTKTTVTDKDGKIISTDDPNAQAEADEQNTKKEEKLAAVANAPKRQANDPIQTVLFQTQMTDALRRATSKEGVFPYLRKEFDHDAVIKIMDQKRVDSYAKDYDFTTGKYKAFTTLDRSPEFLPADVYVETFATMEDEVGINKATKKLASAPFLKYRAVIHSEFTDKTWEVTDEGIILANAEVTKRFAGKIRETILKEVGTTIPAEASKFRRATPGMTSQQATANEDLQNQLQNLFNHKKKT